VSTSGTLTRDQYLALMEGRTRTLDEPYLSNAKALKWRNEQAAHVGSPIDATVTLAQQVADARQQRSRSRCGHSTTNQEPTIAAPSQSAPPPPSSPSPRSPARWTVTHANNERTHCDRDGDD
jgi:hypothetical protein